MKAVIGRSAAVVFVLLFGLIVFSATPSVADTLFSKFKENKDDAINNYINALKLGGTKTLPELYAAAGLKFSFAPDYISELMLFVQQELEKITRPVHS